MANKKQEQPKPKMRYGGSEILLLKSTFKDNHPLLMALRKVFLQAELKEEDITALKPVTENSLVMDLLRKTYAHSVG